MAYDAVGLRARRAAGRARAWPGQGACHDTIVVSWLRGATIVSRYRAARAAIRRRMHHDTALVRATRPSMCAQSVVSRYNFCIVTRGSETGCETARQLALARGDTTGHACDTTERKDTIRSAEACDTAPSALCTRIRRCARAMCTQLGSGCAPCAPNPVLTQCIVLSHCLRHCS